MARTCLIPPQISVLKSGAALVKPVSKVWMFKSTKLSVNKTLTFQIRSSIKNKVFEDLSKGIICYRDDNGEIICEGYDDDDDHDHEQPCFHQQIEKKSTYPSLDQIWRSRLIIFYNKVGFQWLNSKRRRNYTMRVMIEENTE